MSDITRIDQNARRSRASVFGDLVFLAGQVADTKPCRGAMAADRRVGEKEMVNLAAQTAQKLRHRGAVLR